MESAARGMGTDNGANIRPPDVDPGVKANGRVRYLASIDRGQSLVNQRECARTGFVEANTKSKGQHVGRLIRARRVICPAKPRQWPSEHK